MAYIGIGAAVVIAVATAGILGTQQASENMAQDKVPVRNESSTLQAPSSQKLNVSSLIASGAPFKGDPDAEVAIVDFSDYQCTNCRRFALQTEPQVERDYINTGDAVLIFKHFPVFGPDSVTASMASMCAHDQDMFWQFHNHLYQNQGFENSGWAHADNMKTFASNVGLGREQFDSCLDGEKYRSYVEDDLSLALGLGFPMTPSFIVMKNDGTERENMFGAQPYTSFKTILNKKLTQS